MSVWSFFFQAEAGIRDVAVTGVQTCALPISCDPDGTDRRSGKGGGPSRAATRRTSSFTGSTISSIRIAGPETLIAAMGRPRSEARRVGDEGESRGVRYIQP